ncbi:hypothetical protein V6N12_068954 [Hibiscus sabdariffa]|uniref:Uncharacterized protein n=1 Tax=Hibiscus sabdariffa TaxID=183260 RepID=A0ABR2CAB8_9ROSI
MGQSIQEKDIPLSRQGQGAQEKFPNQWAKPVQTCMEGGGSSTLNSHSMKQIISHIEEEEMWNRRCTLVGETAMSDMARYFMGSVTLLESRYIVEISLDLGENTNHTLDCEKVTMLITTSIESKISEVVEIEVGNLSFMVRVEEKGVLDHSAQLQVEAANLKKNSKKLNHDNKSNSNTSLDSSMSPSPVKGGSWQEVEDDCFRSFGSASDSSMSPSPVKGGSWQEVEDDVINVVLMGKELSHYCDVENCMSNILGEEELMGKASRLPNHLVLMLSLMDVWKREKILMVLR